jgi:phosphatidylethanolamine/phosphatidyl-N-methylethanolamine N-methyltransferase
MLNSVPRDYSLIAPVYDHVFNKFLSEGHRTLGELLKSKKTIPGYKVLEVGVGSGLTFDYLPNGIEYSGIDINKKMLTLAHLKAKSHKRKKITLAEMDAHKLTYKSNSFDMVMAASVVSAVENPEKVLKEMIRVAKKGGQIAVITNVRESNYKSRIVKSFDPFTKKFLGFRTDMDSNIFSKFKELELIESRPVNNVMGFQLSTYLLFKKK